MATPGVQEACSDSRALSLFSSYAEPVANKCATYVGDHLSRGLARRRDLPRNVEAHYLSAPLYAACAGGDARRGLDHASARLPFERPQLRRTLCGVDLRAAPAPPRASAFRSGRNGAGPRRHAQNRASPRPAWYGLARTLAQGRGRWWSR